MDGGFSKEFRVNSECEGEGTARKGFRVPMRALQLQSWALWNSMLNLACVTYVA